jgi:hypothetical protein
VIGGRALLRQAGRGTADDGSIITWSMATGRRGSRWREVRATDASVVSSLLLELDPDDRFSHLELATAVGLLTLHPEGDGSLHGNAVEAAGVRHVVALRWARDDALLVVGSSIARAAAARRVRQAGPQDAVDGVVVGLDLSLERRTISPVELAVDLDPDGLPSFGDGRSWPLELES